MIRSVLIVGCGYLGRRVGRDLVAEGVRVIGTTRTLVRGPELERWGIDPVRADVLDPGSLDALPEADAALFCVGLDRSSGASRRGVYVDGLRRVLDRLAGRVGRLVHASSTGVYGQDDGGWVDEAATAEPRGEPGQVMREAEGVVGEFQSLDATILRFSGLYGPGRIIRRESLERGDPIEGDPDHWLNLIHIDDAARLAALSVLGPGRGPLFVASDDRPVRRREFYEATAALLGLPAPRFVHHEPGPGQGPGRDGSNKRVANGRIKAALGVELLYPDITTGLPAALR